MHFPTVMGAVVLTYNIEGVSGALKFTPEAIAGIYLGKITKWNDPALTGPNPGVALPNQDIIVIHRADGSGTTYIFTDYLSKVSPVWDSKVGKSTSVNWPVGLGGKGNEGVTGLVKQSPSSIGYVELIYALSNQLPFGDVKNQSGAFVKPSLESVTAAAAGYANQMPDDFRVMITNAPGPASYPISGMTWLLVYEKQKDADKGKAAGAVHQLDAPRRAEVCPRPAIRAAATGGRREGTESSATGDQLGRQAVAAVRNLASGESTPLAGACKHRLAGAPSELTRVPSRRAQKDGSEGRGPSNPVFLSTLVALLCWFRPFPVAAQLLHSN